MICAKFRATVAAALTNRHCTRSYQCILSVPATADPLCCYEAHVSHNQNHRRGKAHVHGTAVCVQNSSRKSPRIYQREGGLLHTTDHHVICACFAALFKKTAFARRAIATLTVCCTDLGGLLAVTLWYSKGGRGNTHALLSRCRAFAFARRAN